MDFLYWLYVVVCLWAAQRRGQRSLSTAEYLRVVSSADETRPGMPSSGLPPSEL